MAKNKINNRGNGQNRFTFADNSQARTVCGVYDENLKLIEHAFQLDIHTDGNALILAGTAENRDKVRAVLTQLVSLAAAANFMPTPADTQNIINRENAKEKPLSAKTAAKTIKSSSSSQAVSREKTEPLSAATAAAVFLNATENTAATADIPISAFSKIITRKKQIYARTKTQNAYIKAMQQAQLVFGIGPAGTGKTYLAVAYAAAMLEQGLVERIILSRPAVEAGERLGFLPGDMKEKVDPYLRPLYDALYDMMPAEKVERALNQGIIEIAPLAFMRGRTLAHSAIILDEAQNTTAMQMKMLLTRLGEGSHMVINGDPSQIDLPAGQQSGLLDAVMRLSGLEHIAVIRFSDADVIRHPLVASIIRAYAAKNKPEQKL